MRWLPTTLAGAAALAWALAAGAPARALSLADLAAGATFASADGQLTFRFDAGSVLRAGDLPSLDRYEVVALGSGFRIAGPILVADGKSGGIVLEYTVEAGPGLVIEGAELFFNGVAFGGSAGASVSEDFSTGHSLAVAVTGGGLSVKRVSVGLSPPVASLDVLKSIQVVTGAGGQLASASVVDQVFAVIPEPGTLLLLGGGLAMLAARRSRGRRA